MIPLSDVIPSRTTPWITLTLIAVNLAIVIGELWLPTDDLREIIYALGVIPESLRPVTLVTSLFLHPGLTHALSNLAALWLFGDNIEDRMGHGRFLVFYLLTGAAGALAEALTHSSSPFPLVGASSAVAGIIGAYIAMFPRSRTLVLVPLPWDMDIVEIPTLLLVAGWLLLQSLGADGHLTRAVTIGQPAIVAQLTGALVGAAAVWLFRRPERMTVEWRDR
jgi:membrane associated rhomboid family serine protease